MNQWTDGLVDRWSSGPSSFGHMLGLLFRPQQSKWQIGPDLCVFLPLFLPLSLPVSELQEEGINAINLPLSPTHYELDPEDTMLGESFSLLYTQKHTFTL